MLAAQQNCSRCGLAMREQPRPDVSDGVSWWCLGCKTRKNIRHGSFFTKSHITQQNWLLLLHFWARDYPVTSVAEDVGIDSSTVCDVYQWNKTAPNTNFTWGSNSIVQIDESLFRHKPKVCTCTLQFISVLTLYMILETLMAQIYNIG